MKLSDVEDTNPYASDYLRSTHVQSMLGISRSTIHLWIKTREFPKPIPIGGRLSLYRKKDVVDWVEEQFSKHES